MKPPNVAVKPDLCYPLRTMNNVTLTAMLVAVLATTHAVSSLLRGWHNRLFRSFAAFCLVIATANVAFVMTSLAPSRGWYVAQLLGALTSAPVAVTFFLRLLGKPQPRGASLRPLLRPVWAALSLLVVYSYEPLALSGEPGLVRLIQAEVGNRLGELESMGLMKRLWTLVAWVGGLLVDHPSTILVPLAVGVYVAVAFGAIWLNVLERTRVARSGIERTRLLLLAALGGATMVAVLVQGAAYHLGARSIAIPVGGLTQLVFIAFLSQVILLYRLLDLHETISKGMIFAAQVLIIGGVYGVLVGLFGDRNSWANLAITIILASGVVSLLHEPLRNWIERTIHRVFFRRRYEMLSSLHRLEKELPRILSVDDLLKALMRGLTDVPRITHAAVFLWDERSRDYRCVARSGPEGWPPQVAVVGMVSFVEELRQGEEPLESEDLAREIEGSRRRREEMSGALAALSKLDAHVAVPLRGDGLLYGFVILKDDSLHEGFTHDELRLLQSLADRASVIIQNSNAIQRMKERNRLAALGEMAAGLAHEIRNPLGAIRGAAQYIANEVSDENREFVNIIMEEVDRLNVVVTEFLDYSRPLQVRVEAHNLNRLVSQVVTLFSAQGLPEGVTVTTELDDDLPPVPLDAEKIKQVLLNLLQNALQAVPNGGRITVRTKRAPRRSFAGTRVGEATLDRVAMEVEDTGEGMTPTQLERLFIPFFTTKPGGTGLGLAICQRLVQAHEGDIEVHSAPGKGTRFVVHLPLFPSSTAQVSRPTEKGSGSG